MDNACTMAIYKLTVIVMNNINYVCTVLSGPKAYFWVLHLQFCHLIRTVTFFHCLFPLFWATLQIYWLTSPSFSQLPSLPSLTHHSITSFFHLLVILRLLGPPQVLSQLLLSPLSCEHPCLELSSEQSIQAADPVNSFGEFCWKK